MSNVPQRLLWFSSILTLNPRDRVLEIGCGSGHLLALLAARSSGAALVGIDRSALQIRRATRRLDALPTPPQLLQRSLTEAPAHFAGERFSRIVAMNVNHVWTKPAAAGHALRSLLAPRGVVVLGFEPPSPSGRPALEAKLAQAAALAGFRPRALHRDRASNAFAVEWTVTPRRAQARGALRPMMAREEPASRS